jgi:hypothetical protein
MTRPSAGPSTAAAAPTASSASMEAPDPPGNSEHTSENPTEATEDDSSADGEGTDSQEGAGEQNKTRDASTCTHELQLPVTVVPVMKPAVYTPEQSRAIDAAYLEAVSRSSDRLVFIPSLAAPDSENDTVEGCVFGCVCVVAQGGESQSCSMSIVFNDCARNRVEVCGGLVTCANLILWYARSEGLSRSARAGWRAA